MPSVVPSDPAPPATQQSTQNAVSTSRLPDTGDRRAVSSGSRSLPMLADESHAASQVLATLTGFRFLYIAGSAANFPAAERTFADSPIPPALGYLAAIGGRTLSAATAASLNRSLPVSAP